MGLGQGREVPSLRARRLLAQGRHELSGRVHEHPDDRGGEVTGAVVVFKDITERRQTEELLERQRRQLVEAQSVGEFRSSEWDIAADTIEWSAQLCRIYGLEPGSHPATFGEVTEFTHRDDDRALMQASVQSAFESGEPFSLTTASCAQTEPFASFRPVARWASGEDGTPLRMLGTGQDITERREVERAKDEFTSVVSHELRTPLTAIRGSLGLLKSGVLGPLPEKGRRMVEIAIENSDRQDLPARTEKGRSCTFRGRLR